LFSNKNVCIYKLLLGKYGALVFQNVECGRVSVWVSVWITLTQCLHHNIYWRYATHTRGNFLHMSLSKTCRMVSGWILGGKREPSLPPDIRLQESVVQCGRWVRPLNLSRAANNRMSVAPVNTVILSREVPFFYCQSEVSVEVRWENPAWHAKKNNTFRLVHCNCMTHKRIIL